MREAKERGYRMGLLTNNVREWEPLWRTMLPVDEIFEVVVDSGFVGCRKPDREIYELTLERLGGASPQECLFIDDTDVNCDDRARTRHVSGPLPGQRPGDPRDPQRRSGLS